MLTSRFPSLLVRQVHERSRRRNQMNEKAFCSMRGRSCTAGSLRQRVLCGSVIAALFAPHTSSSSVVTRFPYSIFAGKLIWRRRRRLSLNVEVLLEFYVGTGK